MKINCEVELFGSLCTKNKEKKLNLVLEKSITIEELLLKYLKFKKKEIKFLSPVVNENNVDIDYEIKNNDKIKILMPIGGG
ncbi:MAG TPA: MoaD/ThiS family protein [bacterium]|nr:MoaD/ThiS family protein [bacterium]HOL46719.1 MoaD/ThiS family protein [bacterium]HPQ18155.1 MoaD/ThiS family protein [bacterium]